MSNEKIMSAVNTVESTVRTGTSYMLYQAAERLLFACEFAPESVWRDAEDVRQEAFDLTNPDGRGRALTRDERAASLTRLHSRLKSIRRALERRSE